jgi:uncharacterized membrane protein
LPARAALWLVLPAALQGCFGGFQTRTGLVKALGTRDFYVAVIEDLVAIAGCFWVVSRF